MSLIRQIWSLLLATLVLAFAASVTVNVKSARDTLQTQVSLKNSDNAAALAQAMSQQKGQVDLMALTAAAQYDTGYYQRIRWIGADGVVRLDRQAPAVAGLAPGWFVALFPVEPVPGVAQVSDGWHALGRLEVASQVGYAYDDLWQSSWHTASALALVGVLVAGLAAAGVARIRRPLDQMVRQATLVERGEYLTLPEPRVPELRRVTRALNSMVDRLRVVFETQAAEVEALRREAACDAATGLANRSHFMARLATALQREDGPAAGGLVLLRVLELAELNQSLGRALTDRLLVVIADTLEDWTGQVAGSFAGRLNGTDFAIALPLGGAAAQSAQAVVELLRYALAEVAGAPATSIRIAAGAVETQHGIALATVMGEADLALAQAETEGPFAIRAGDAGLAPWATLGERGWRERVHEALAEGQRARLVGFPVVDSQQRLLHLECPLRLQLEPGGAFEVAARWLPLAIRSRLTGEADERALALALQHIAFDGRPRCINLSPASLADAGFVARLRALLEAMPREARQVWIEVAESAAVEQFDRVCEAARQLRPTGARFGLEHAGERLGRIERLYEAGLDYVKLDAATGSGVAADPNRARFVKGLVTMLHGLSLRVMVEGVDDAEDARCLWALGVDGITGPLIGADPDVRALADPLPD